MKKIKIIFFGFVLISVLYACKNTITDKTEKENTVKPEKPFDTGIRNEYINDTLPLRYEWNLKPVEKINKNILSYRYYYSQSNRIHKIDVFNSRDKILSHSIDEFHPASLHEPVAFRFKDDLFIYISESQSGSGNHNKKNIYHLDTLTWKPSSVLVFEAQILYKDSLGFGDSVYIRKGEHFQIKENSLDFSFGTWKKDATNDQKFKIVIGQYQIINSSEGYLMEPFNFTCIPYN